MEVKLETSHSMGDESRKTVEDLRVLMYEFTADGGTVEIIPTPSDSDTILEIALNSLRAQGFGPTGHMNVPRVTHAEQEKVDGPHG